MNSKTGIALSVVAIAAVIAVFAATPFVVAHEAQASLIGLEINVVSVAFLSIMIWLRFYYSQSRKRTIEAQT